VKKKESADHSAAVAGDTGQRGGALEQAKILPPEFSHWKVLTAQFVAMKD